MPRNRQYPKFDDSISQPEEAALSCPECGDAWLHQAKVEVFNRPEDADEGNHVTVEGQSVSVDRSIEDNPSPRRSGIKIHFWCEHCNGTGSSTVGALCIVQHKGNEFMYWTDSEL